MRGLAAMRRTGWVLVSVLWLVGCAGGGAVKPSSEDVFAQVHRADAAYALGHWDEAARGYRAVIARVPKDAYAWFRLGNVRLQQGRYAAAIEAYQAARAQEPGWAKVYYNLSTVYLLQAQAMLSQGSGRAQAGQRGRFARRSAALTRVLYGAPAAARRVVRPSRPKVSAAGRGAVLAAGVAGDAAEGR